MERKNKGIIYKEKRGNKEKIGKSEERGIVVRGHTSYSTLKTINTTNFSLDRNFRNYRNPSIKP